MPNIQHKRGLFANLPATGILAGQLYLTTDRLTVHVGKDATNLSVATPAIELLANMPAISGAADFLIMHDADGAGQREKKITFNDFKTALNIPAGASDEKVAVIAGGASGYVWGTDGTDGILRMNSSLTWSKDASNGFVTLGVNNVDCGTF